jgi:7-cyano-7-deazaguanine synthase in queuosine biosynthesis
MTDYLVRTDLDTPTEADPDTRLLDWSPSSAAATIHTGDSAPAFFGGWSAPRAAADLLLLGAAVYCADKTTSRLHTPDAWTRDIAVWLPVGDPSAWDNSDFDAALGFLTGDHWQISAYRQRLDPLASAAIDAEPLRADAVCLFSGGLDSLCGVIDLLEESPTRRVVLVSHHEGGQTSTAQRRIYDALADHYGRDRVPRRALFLRPAPPNSRHQRPLPARRENTTRSRSVLFLSAALAIAAALGPDTPVYVPENGFIGINVPLTRARAGSASTRTTHPHFMELFGSAANAVGVSNPILNPYRLLTKGEILAQSQNPTLLRRLALDSVSCSHPETARYVGRTQGNCGYCFPCLIRRASLAHVGWDDDTYAWNVFDDADAHALLHRGRRGADLRAVLAGAFADRPDTDALRNGPLPDGQRGAYTAVWRRGLAELRTWLGQAPEVFAQSVGAAAP